MSDESVGTVDGRPVMHMKNIFCSVINPKLFTMDGDSSTLAPISAAMRFRLHCTRGMKCCQTI